MAKVYVSSTIADLSTEREAVMKWLISADHQPVHSYRPDSETVRESCLEDIDRCDLYVLILGHRYGFQPEPDNPNHLSITHLEFRRAKQSKLPRIALLRTNVPDIKLSDLLNTEKAKLVQAFEEEVRREVRPAEFNDLSGLIQGLSTGVQHELENLRPVVRMDDPRTLQIVATLTDELARKSRMIDQQEAENLTLRGRVKELEDKLLHSAVARTLTAAAQPDAGEAEIAAADALEAGDTQPAEVLLEKQELREVRQIGAPGVDEVSQRQEAASLAREQGALAMGHNLSDALSAFQRAAEYEPDDTWTHFFIGDLHLLLGRLGAAMDSFGSAIATIESRVQANPEDINAQRDFSVSHNKIAEVLVAQGDLPGALNAYRRNLEISRTLAARDSANTLWQRDLSVSHEKIGEVLVAQGDLPGALNAYRISLGIRETLAARDSANTQWQRDLAVSHLKIGEVLVAEGDLPGALNAYRKYLEISETLVARDSANTLWQRDLSVSHEKIGEVLVAQGDLPGALNAYRKNLEIRETLAARDSANTQWQRDLSVSHLKIGEVLVAQGDLSGALNAYRISLAISETLVARDSANTQWQRDLSVSHEKIGEVLVAHGDLPGALNAYRISLEIRETLGARDSANTQWQRDLAVSHEKIGEVLVAQGDLPSALNAYRKNLEVRQALAARDPANTEWQTDVAVSLSKLGTLAHLPRDRRREYLERGRKILVELKERDRLLPRQDWIAWFDEQLSGLASKREDTPAN